MPETSLTGGCQCGAVRYLLLAPPREVFICHCRMCQKQFGNFFGSFANVDRDQFEVTRGELSYFRSSDDTERSFCSNCGTPLGYRLTSPPSVGVSLGSLDHHSLFRPVRQYGIESREPWLHEVVSLPGVETEANDMPERLAAIRLSNRQHPDHPTDEWPPHLDKDTPSR